MHQKNNPTAPGDTNRRLQFWESPSVNQCLSNTMTKLLLFVCSFVQVVWVFILFWWGFFVFLFFFGEYNHTLVRAYINLGKNYILSFPKKKKSTPKTDSTMPEFVSSLKQVASLKTYTTKFIVHQAEVIQPLIAQNLIKIFSSVLNMLISLYGLFYCGSLQLC